MSYYLRYLRSSKCEKPGCYAVAAAEVIGPEGQSNGKFCLADARELVRKLRRQAQHAASGD